MRIAIIGASKDKKKFGNKAVRAYRKNNHVVFPVNPNARQIEGLKCYSSVREIPLEVDAASIYLPPEIALKIIPEIVMKGIPQVILNPGSDSKQIIKILKKNNIEVKQVCSIRYIGEDPDKY